MNMPVELSCNSGIISARNLGDRVDILYREKERDFLINFFGPDVSVPYPSLFIYGHTATGKTLLVSKLIKNLNLNHIWVNSHEAHSSQIIFKLVIRQLSKHENQQPARNYNLCEFICYLRNSLKDKSQTTYLIFDDAEVLRNEDPFILSVLVRLQDLTKVNICTIFISELPWIKFKTPMISCNPLSLHFPNYTKNQISEILSLDCPENYEKTFYENYINVILKTFYTVTRNLSELRHLARIHFEKYCEPLEDENDADISSLRLWRNIETTLKEAMNSVYLREISGYRWKAHCKMQNSNDETEPKQPSLVAVKYSVTRELPFYSKFLLLSAYFASYNAPKTDFKHFVKNQGKQKKKRNTKKVEKNRHLLGPKPFSLDRMLSIFFTIVGERVLPSALIFSQISSLVSMRLISRISTDEQLDCPKYKCLAELDLVQKIGKTVNIDVLGYLDDFL